MIGISSEFASIIIKHIYVGLISPYNLFINEIGGVRIYCIPPISFFSIYLSVLYSLLFAVFYELHILYVKYFFNNVCYRSRPSRFLSIFIIPFYLLQGALLQV